MMSDDLKELIETLNKINEGSSKKPGSVMNEPYGTFHDLEQAQANFKPKKRKGSLLGKSVRKSDDPFRGKLVGSCEESKKLKESKIKKGSKVSFPEHGIETPGTVIGRKKENSSKKSVIGSGFPKYKINAGHGVKLDIPADKISAIAQTRKPKKQHKASKTIALKDSLQAIAENYPRAVAIKAGRKYQILTEAEGMNTKIPPTVIGQGINIQTAWINAEERINAKIAKYSATIRKMYPLAVARKEGNSFWIKESPSGEAISFSKPTLTEAWKNAVDLETKKN